MPFWVSEKLRLLPLSWLEARVVPGECDCWLWSAGKNKGRLTAILTSGRGRQQTFDARRLVYRLVHGRTPRRGLSPRCPHHECCVNPDHLLLRALSPVHGSEALWRDSISRGRRAASQVMSDAKARQIRESTDTLRVVAARVGCSIGLASLIRRGLAWPEAASPFSRLLMGVVR